MKKLSILLLVGIIESSQAVNINHKNELKDNVWAESLADIDQSLYTKDTPKDYTEAEKPKPDPKALELQWKRQQ